MKRESNFEMLRVFGRNAALKMESFENTPQKWALKREQV